MTNDYFHASLSRPFGMTRCHFYAVNSPQLTAIKWSRDCLNTGIFSFFRMFNRFMRVWTVNMLKGLESGVKKIRWRRKNILLRLVLLAGPRPPYGGWPDAIFPVRSHQPYGWQDLTEHRMLWLLFFHRFPCFHNLPVFTNLGEKRMPIFSVMNLFGFPHHFFMGFFQVFLRFRRISCLSEYSGDIP